MPEKTALWNKHWQSTVGGLGDVVAGLNEDGTVVVSADSNVDKDIERACSRSDIVLIKTGNKYIVGLDKDGNLHGAWDNIVAVGDKDNALWTAVKAVY